MLYKNNTFVKPSQVKDEAQCSHLGTEWLVFLALLCVLYPKQVEQEANALIRLSGFCISCHRWEVGKESAAPYLQAHTQDIKEGRTDSEETSNATRSPEGEAI